MCITCDTTSKPEPDRRAVLRLGAIGVATAIVGSLRTTGALAECAPFTAEMQSASTPEMALDLLVQGHERFARGASLYCSNLHNAKATAAKQTPFACVLACIDSRSAPEVVFDQQIGDIFTARVAGNIPTAEIIGSFEFGTKVAGAKVIVVLGHTHCGAIKGAIDKAVVGDKLTQLLDAIEPAVMATPLTGERSSENHHFVESVAETNVRQSVNAFSNESPVLKELVDSGQLLIVGAIYDLDTAQVHFLT